MTDADEIVYRCDGIDLEAKTLSGHVEFTGSAAVGYRIGWGRGWDAGCASAEYMFVHALGREVLARAMPRELGTEFFD